MKPLSSPTASAKTRTRIIRAAESLFAEKGFRAMTLREVTRDARVNLAAVNYHFGSKMNLMRAVIERRFEPINRERLRQLDAAVAAAGKSPLPLETIFAALFKPLFDQVQTPKGPDRTLIQMIGRALTEPADFMRGMHREFFLELSQRFLRELRRSCPDMPEADLQFRFFLSISTMLGTITEQVRLENLTAGKLSGGDLDQVCSELTTFVVAGFRQGTSASSN